MAGGIDLNFNVGGEKRRREQEARKLAMDILDRGGSPEQANQAQDILIKTGKAVYPTTQTVDSPQSIVPTPGPIQDLNYGRPTIPASVPYSNPGGEMGTSIEQPISDFKKKLTMEDLLAASVRGGQNNLSSAYALRNTQPDVPILDVNPTKGTVDKIGTAPKNSIIATVPTPKTDNEDKDQSKLYKDSVAALQKFYGSRSGNFGVQDAKVNQAYHLGNLADQYYDPKTDQYNIPEAQFNETVMGLANLVSGSNVSTVEALKSITPKNFQSDMSHIISYWTGKPITNQPQAMIRNILDSIDRQGSVSEDLRDKYLNQAKDLFIQPGLNDENIQRVMKSQVGSSYKEFLKNRKSASPEIPTITNQADYDKLPSGASYLSSDGVPHKKK